MTLDGQDMLKRLVVAGALSVLTLGCAVRSSPIILDHRADVRLTGTFSSLHVDKQGVFGAEVRIAVTDTPPYQALVQFGVGEVCRVEDHGREPCFGVSNLFVADVEFGSSNNSSADVDLTFRLPSAGAYAGVFEGQVSSDVLVGTFTFAGGRRLALTLKRGQSHWDRALVDRRPTGRWSRRRARWHGDERGAAHR
jgi:hypothetical protein